MITMAFGYALQVTPMHTLMLYNAIANNGKMMKPYLVSRYSTGWNYDTNKLNQRLSMKKFAIRKIVKDDRNV